RSARKENAGGPPGGAREQKNVPRAPPRTPADARVQRASPTLDERCEGGLDFAVAADIEDFDLLPTGRGRSPDVRDKRLGRGEFGVDEHGNARGSRPQLTQEPKLFRPKFRRAEADTGDVATGPVEAGHD